MGLSPLHEFFEKRNENNMKEMGLFIEIHNWFIVNSKICERITFCSGSFKIFEIKQTNLINNDNNNNSDNNENKSNDNDNDSDNKRNDNKNNQVLIVCIHCDFNQKNKKYLKNSNVNDNENKNENKNYKTINNYKLKYDCLEDITSWIYLTDLTNQTSVLTPFDMQQKERDLRNECKICYRSSYLGIDYLYQACQ